MIKTLSIAFYFFALFFALSCTNKKIDTYKKPVSGRWISLSGALTESLVALGFEENIVGVDITSTYPASIKNKVQLGHISNISAESLLSLHPDMIWIKKDELPTRLEAQLRATGVRIEAIAQKYSPEGTQEMVREIAEKLKVLEKAFVVLQNIRDELSKLKTIEPSPSVLFIYARGPNMLMVSGKDTPMDRIISLAGGQNAITSFSGFKPLAPEFLLEAKPRVILLFESGWHSLKGFEGLSRIPAMKYTPAFKNRSVIAMDGALLSGFGPRLGQAARDLNASLEKIKTDD